MTPTPIIPKADEARAFADETTPFAESKRDESLELLQPESGRWPLAHGMRTSLARAAWESGWDAAISALSAPSPAVGGEKVEVTDEEVHAALDAYVHGMERYGLFTSAMRAALEGFVRGRDA